MTCPRCQASSREGARFCEQCGGRLATTCPSCNAETAQGSRFCGACGAALPGAAPTPTRFGDPQSYTPKHLADKILTARAHLEGERKLVTVLFADLKGSMELLADRDPEEARKLLDPVLERMMEAVHRYEGTVNQVMGDGIMALFGAPVGHEDHAVRACHASLRMQETVGWYADELRRTQGIDVQIRVGINSGEVVVRAIDSDLHMDYSAIGQTTHLAARMEQLARPGTALMTKDTLRLAEGYIEVRPLGPVPVRGLAETVEVFEIVRAGAVRSRLQAAAARGLTPFVGRDNELVRLRQTLEKAYAGQGQLVAVAGEPGVGKSRLFWEFTHSHRTHGWLVLESSPVSYAKMNSYLPVSDLLKTYFGIGDHDDARRIREKITGKLLTLDETLRPTIPVFLSLLDVPMDDGEWQEPDPRERRRRTLDALKRLLLRESQVQPLLVIFENLNWVDSETQAFLDSLVESLPAARILLMVNYRPEYTHGWGGKSYYTQFRMDPLQPESAEELLQALLGTDAALAPIKQLLVRQTEGNPFFLEECVQSLVETKALQGERGQYKMAKSVGTLQMPPTVQAVLAARIDRLQPEDKRLLQAASVIGKDISFALLEAIAELADEPLRGGLMRLQAAEFIYETSLFPTLEYTFKHALTHDVSYASLLQGRRRTLHARVVDALERVQAERLGEHVDRLAHHAVRGEVWGKAAAYLRQAAAKAASRAGNEEAVALLEQALQILVHLPDGRAKLEQAIDIRLELRPPLLQLGRLPEVLQLSKEAEQLGTELGDESRLARVYSYLVNYHYLKGEPDLAIDYGERCLRIADATQDLGLQALARGYLGYSCHAQGQYRRAEFILRQNVEALERTRETDTGTQTAISYVTSSGWLAFTLAELGDFHAADACADQAMRAADEAGHVYGQTIARTLAGLVWLRRGHLDRARELLQPSLDACREKHLDVWRPIPSSLLGLTLALRGHVDSALPLLEDGVHLSEVLGINAYLSLWTLHKAEGLLAAGEPARAGEAARHALDLAVAHKERGHQAWAWRLLGEVASREGGPGLAQAEEHYRQALAIAEELKMQPLVAHVRMGWGRVCRLLGDRLRAEEHLVAAFTLFREMDVPFWVKKCGEEMMQVGEIFIVARYNPQLYEYLQREFSGQDRVRIIMDRRVSERRQSRGAATEERRQSERRQHADVDTNLRERGFVILPTESAGGGADAS
ncbi:MAG TPA: adenylate/guanylate cyclase domain-containing protein [Methylomirabilota bacterium]|nr:adenylate/guanylate cyclase domain-containing protein [Methylomirabilota bacterium]